jgi:hypothetical protein
MARFKLSTVSFASGMQFASPRRWLTLARRVKEKITEALLHEKGASQGRNAEIPRCFLIRDIDFKEVTRLYSLRFLTHKYFFK